MKKIFALLICIKLSANPTIALLTYPHSGTQWLTYCVCQLTHRPGFVLNEKVWKWNNSKLLLTQNQQKAPFYHTHRPRFLTHIAQDFRTKKDGKLLIILRNFKESLFRRVDTLAKAVNLIKHARSQGGDFYKLIQNLEYFESFPKDRRLLVYYEDLIQQPQKTLQKVLNFTEDKADIDAFVTELKTHRERCLDFYNTTPSLPGTRSFGATKFHTAKVDKQQLRYLDRLFIVSFPNLWKHFERFQD